MQITFYSDGDFTWKIGGKKAFSPELVTHEFGHLLNYGYGQNTLSSVLVTAYSGNLAVTRPDKPTAEDPRVSIWKPFEHGAGTPDGYDRSSLPPQGRFYGTRGDKNPDELTAEAYAVWVHDQIVSSDSEYNGYNYAASTVYDPQGKQTIEQAIADQKAFWSALFSGEINLSKILPVGDVGYNELVEAIRAILEN